ncbi:4-hydroxy-tetrahydrodipicolinate synthase [Ruminiclostridium sufflavum DSM 19573]|uniref:4-hydroxy-tetrahydrodipicolinate synthase n=1 Tax=Ruminiclostridium sufflavum DSM 19573 TaxID=1121337 RepID=A0A318XPD5_9FIRM|nr:dihydrodipicolinate synthase family protein [Ruminiclostridium sufflavum]PYG87962.1 4-hydroxy-tetrahydrodipicolinate synthase [Ruminiclostridium sufflavum DSM 19573]
MNNNFPGGVWPVMLTPYNEKQEIDFNALKELVDWYIKEGVSGLFAVCQSSEMFNLSLEERIELSRSVVKAAAGRVPVIASGHISDSFEDQVAEINEISKTGIDAMILITNRLAREDESDEIWLDNCKKLLKELKTDIPLGFYECPYPYKRLLSIENIKWCAETGRFFFLKDTCCDAEEIRQKLEAIKGSSLKLYNANSSTLLESLRDGATGYSGVMANFHPSLYAWLCKNYEKVKAEDLSDMLAITSLIERQYYPVNAKYYLKTFENIPISTFSRVKEASGLSETFKKEIAALNKISQKLIKQYLD